MTNLSREMSQIKDSWRSDSDMQDPFLEEDIFADKPTKKPVEYDNRPKRQKTTFKKKGEISESHSFSKTESNTRSKRSSDRRADPQVA
jgi:hypothetical protein